MSVISRESVVRPLVVIPALNAARTLPPILDRLVSHDTLVVDDGSEDETFLVAKSMATAALRHERNQGHSAAIISGENYALTHGYSHVLLLDSDGQHPPEYAQEAINLLELHDLVIGDRFSSLENIPSQKIASNLFASLLIECATGYFLRDVSCGFRGYSLNSNLHQ
jgi:glycosyltransferase involved in cell wall biosynthesis